MHILEPVFPELPDPWLLFPPFDPFPVLVAELPVDPPPELQFIRMFADNSDAITREKKNVTQCIMG